MKALRVVLVVLGSLTSCAAPPASSVASVEARGTVAPGPFDWTIGTWVGTRRGAADGVSEPMTMRIEPILGGAGQARHIEIPYDGGVYRGFAVQVARAEDGVWQRRYVNAERGTFAEYACTFVDERRSEWRSVTPSRTRESRLVSERSDDGTWTRTMLVSEDEGATWRELWVDELRRV